MIALWVLLAIGSPPADLSAARDASISAARDALDGPVAREQLAILHEALIDRPAHADAVDADTGALARRALGHPDPRVRRIAVQAVRPWVAPTLHDPPGPGPTPFLDVAAIGALVRDPDPGVRRQTLQILRSPHAALDRGALGEAMLRLLEDPHGGVRAAAFRALPDAVHHQLVSPERAFDLALLNAREPVPAGRSACNQVARLAPVVRDRGVPIDRAFSACLEHHPERAWAIAAAWSDVLPTREDQVRRLLYETVGLSGPVLRRWVMLDRDLVERVLASWPSSASPERLELARRLIARDG